MQPSEQIVIINIQQINSILLSINAGVLDIGLILGMIRRIKMTATRIGLKIFDALSFAQDPSQLKRDILLFDKIAIDHDQIDNRMRPEAEFLFKIHNSDASDHFKKLDSDLKYLTDAGLVESIRYSELPCPDEFVDKLSELENEKERHLHEHETRGPYLLDLEDGSKKTVIPLLNVSFCETRIDLLRARGGAEIKSDLRKRFIAYPSGDIQQLFDIRKSDQFNQRKNVLRVVLNAFPTLSSDTDWQEIMIFKNKPETQHNLRQIRSWIVDMANSSLAIEDIQTKLEAQLSDHEIYMKLQNERVETSTLEFLVTGLAEVLEGVMNFKFSALAQKLFQATKENIALSEAELSSPGRDLALIHSAHARFGKEDKSL